jgi:hypothetical protein
MFGGSNLDELHICVHLSVVFQTIGAEYGEGFETFRPDGPLKVDVVRNLAHLLCVFQLFSHIFVEFGYHVILVEAG